MAQQQKFTGAHYASLQDQGLTIKEIANRCNRNMRTVERAIAGFRKGQAALQEIAPGYDLDRSDMTPEEAWHAHTDTLERTLSDRLKKNWRVIKRPKGPFVIFHCTDPHIDDNATPLKVLQADIDASHEMGAVMCHGGDLLNNWPEGGRLAKQWATQECTKPAALLRAEHYIDLMKPDAWVDGNHEEMNPYLSNFLEKLLPKKTLTDQWTVRFVVETPKGNPFRVALSHKFQKGSSWFHKSHGHLREMLEGEEADVFLDGHLHSDGVMDHTLPERGYSALLVASAGYKVTDKYAARISRGGVVPKLRGRCHWIVCDPSAEYHEDKAVAFKSAVRAEAYLGGLQNLRAA